MTDECPECGREFKNKRSLGMHMHHSHDGRPWIPEDELRELYIEDGLSQEQIAEHYDTSKGAVQRAMGKYGIEREKSRNDPTHPPSHKFMNAGDPVGTEYEIVQCTMDREVYTILIHRLIGVAYGKLEPAEFWNGDIVIHHKSEHGLDNRPGNLERMDRGDHQTMHLLDRYDR